MRNQVLRILAATALVALTAGAAAAASALLYPTDSEGDLERQIGKYLKDEKDLKVEYSMWDEEKDDLILKLSFQEEGYPDITISVDAFVSGQVDGQVTETRLKVSAWHAYGIKPGHSHRELALETINSYMASRWIPYRVYLDKDGDVFMESMVNIPGKNYPVHCEYIYDLVIRMAMAWSGLYDHLTEAGL